MDRMDEDRLARRMLLAMEVDGGWPSFVCYV